MNHVSELANYEQRMIEWKKKLIASGKEQLKIGFCVSIIFSLIVYKLSNVTVSFLSILFFAFIINLGLSLIVVNIKIGPMPRKKDVEIDKRLRRHFGMSDKVSED